MKSANQEGSVQEEPKVIVPVPGPPDPIMRQVVKPDSPPLPKQEFNQLLKSFQDLTKQVETL